MAFGITDAGFILKRLQDILTEQRAKAVELFQDQVGVGDVVDTSDSSVIGRLINMDAFGDADLWEVAQLTYNAMDPNSATGIALDNIVQYGGISRQGPSSSTSVGLFAGDNGTLIPTGNTVKSPITNNQYTVVDSVALSPSLAAGVTITVLTVVDSTDYTITYTTGPASSTTITYNSGVGATTANILAGFQALITSSHPLLVATVVGTTLVVDRVDVFQSSTFSTGTRLNITKVKKTGSLQATEFGALEDEANTLTQILTPVLGWDSVTNPLASSPGTLLETDEELRIRFRNTKLERSTNILDSLFSALLNLDGVEEVAIYENDTDVTDANGVLAHSFLPVVLGGSSQLIADTIWENKPMGIRSQGNTVISVTDTQGFPHDIGFERPNPITIYMIINLSLNPEDPTTFPGDGVAQIQSKIQAYAQDNIGVGRDVIFSRLFTPVNEVPGHQIDSMFIGTSPAPATTANIVIDFNELASFESVNIEINVS